MEAPDPVRAFVALELDARVHAWLARLVEDLRPRLPGCRFGAVTNAHLTLRFLGTASVRALESVAAALGPAAAACPPAEVPLTGLGTFPPRGAPRVLWVGLGLPPHLVALQAQCERAARATGFEPEPRRFQPHLTLGRWRDRAPRPELPALSPMATRIEHLTLFASELRPSGAVHTPLARFALGADAPSGPAILTPPR